MVARVFTSARLVFAVLVFCLALATHPPPAYAADCGTLDGLSNLVVRLRIFARAPETPPSAFAAELRRLLNRVDMDQTTGALVTAKRGHLQADLHILMAHVQTIEVLLGNASSRAAHDFARKNGVFRTAETFDELIADLCERPTTTAVPLPDGDELGGILPGRKGGVFEQLPKGAQRLVETFSILAGILLTLFLLHRLQGWIFAILHNRRTCLIPASAEIGELRVAGFVVLLGRRGCTFQLPAEHDLPMSAFKSLRGSPVRVTVARFTLGASCKRADTLGLGLRFNNKLKLRKQRRILEASTISTHVAPNSKRAAAAAGP